MKAARLISVLLYAVMLAVPVTGFTADDEAPPVVNGVTIPQSLIDAIVKAQAAQGHPDTPQLRAQVRNTLITQEILVQQATKLGLDKKADTVAQLKFARQQVLANAFVQNFVRTHPISEAAQRKEYDQLKAKVGGTEYHAHHILVKTEAEAKKIIAELKNGGNFEKIAEAQSIDGTKSNGGDLGWAAPTRYVPAFGDALKKLKKGEITSTPVHTQFGWHVIRLDDTRPLQFPSFEELKPRIADQLEQQAIAKEISSLRAKAKIQ